MLQDNHLKVAERLKALKLKLPSSGFLTNLTSRRSNLAQALFVSSTVIPICPASIKKGMLVA